MSKNKKDNIPENEAAEEKVTETAKETAEEVKDPCQELKEELDRAKDQLLRTMAEYDNYRKRSQREKEAAYSDSKADVISEILPVLDNFERAAMNEDAPDEDYKKGIKMIFQQFDNVLKKLGVEPFGEKGDEFDPNMHNAVMHIEDEELPENTVAQVFAKGYKIGDKVVRHATVQVAN